MTRRSASMRAAERLPAIAVPEERRVREPRPHHALVAVDDLGRVAAFDVGDGDESGSNRPSPSATGK